jgi:hypothetical protein
VGLGKNCRKLGEFTVIFPHVSTLFHTISVEKCISGPLALCGLLAGVGCLFFVEIADLAKKAVREKNFGCGKVFFRSLGYVENSWHLLEKRA